MLIVRCFTLIALLLGLSTSVTARDYVAPSGVSVLTEEQLLNQIIGNTFYNERWTDFYEPPAENQMEGKLRSRHNTYGTHGGSWSIKASLFCVEFDKAPMSAFGDCYTISLDGGNATWYLTDGSTYYPRGGRIKLISGNPNDL